MKIRIYNAKVLTMADGFTPVDGEVWVEGDRIAYAGPDGQLQRGVGENSWDRQINACKNLVLPGFKNAHTHSGMTFLRSHADDLPLLEWLNEQVFPYEARLTAEDIYHLSRLAVMEYLTSGITANFDMYLTPDSIAQASLDCGFRTVLTGALNDFSQSLDQLETWYNKYNEPDSLISFQLGFHAEYTTNKENMQGVAALAKRYQAPVYTHNSEGVPEVEQCIQRTGMTPTAYMDSLGLFDYGGGCYHCVHMTQEDLDIIAGRGVSIVTNPASNLKLASGIAPIQKILDKGINVAIGTDGPASNNCLDMFREMFLAAGLAKYLESDASAVDADQVLYMATVGGARAMQLPDCDTLKPGKKADLIMIDMHQPNMQPAHNISKNLVYSGSKLNVKMTMVNGKVLYENGNFHIGEEPEDIYAKCNEIAGKMFKH